MLEIVSTKLDKLAPKPSSVPVLDELVEFEKVVAEEFRTAGRTIGVSRICAMPRSNFGVGLIGLDELFQGWLAARPLRDVTPLPAIAPARWVDRMLTS